jgi:hypothetical protein
MWARFNSWQFTSLISDTIEPISRLSVYLSLRWSFFVAQLTALQFTPAGSLPVLLVDFPLNPSKGSTYLALPL